MSTLPRTGYAQSANQARVPLDTKSRFLEDEAATIAMGRALAAATQTGQVIPGQGAPTAGGIVYLQGDLGAGKTTLTRGFLRGYGHEGAVKSPTYTLVEPYEFALCNIYHFDLYRLADPEEFNYLGTDQYFDESNLCLVEWSERGSGWVPAGDLLVELIEAVDKAEAGDEEALGSEALGSRVLGREARCSALSARGLILLARLFD